MLDRLAAMAVTGFARVVTGVQSEWRGCVPDPRPRVYYANHVSHGDFVLVWTVLPPSLRKRVRPVAAADYWSKTPGRRFLIKRVFNGVLIERGTSAGRADPIGRMTEALDAGQSLIIFPEGTRNTGEERLLAFKSGLDHLARARPDAEYVPVWVSNLNRVMPKGEFLPVPLLCSVIFGEPQRPMEGDARGAFTERARNALLALAPEDRR
jgi:1-acyl-sn-glycerol-3-phosphate acyltransferase